MAAEIRLGVVGAGQMGALHCRVARQVRDFTLLGIYDPVGDRAANIARQHDVVSYESLDALFSSVDAVIVAAPTPRHAEIAVAALDSGIHTLVEKPIAVDLEESAAIEAAAARSGLVCAVGHVERHNTAFQELLRVLGPERPFAANIRRLNYYATRIDVDVTLDLLIHDVDLLLAMTNELPIFLAATGLRAVDDRLDHVDAVLTFADATVAALTASRVTEDKIRRIEVIASRRYLVADLLRRTVTVHKRASSSWEVSGSEVTFRLDSVTEQVQVPIIEPLQAELADFADAIRTGRPPLVTAPDGTRALRVVLEIQKAAELAAPQRRHSPWPMRGD